MMLLSGVSSSAQLAAPNATGVAMGYLSYRVADVEATKRFWVALGGTPFDRSPDDTQAGRAPRAGIKFSDVLVYLDLDRGSDGGSAGSVVNHVAFRVRSFAEVEARGLSVTRLAQFPGVGHVTTPDGERIELFENAATNLTFTPDSGPIDALAARHNRPLEVPVAFHHIHLYVPEGSVAEAKAWYARVFGGTPGKRSNYDAVDLPGVNFNFSATAKPLPGTLRRRLHGIAFETRDLAAFCKRLESIGIKLTIPFDKDAPLSSEAAIMDPWGTFIYLREGLRKY
jgi:catechol 2,3-dioxygenase-like lactoylglutathione lyase family enzyme